MLELVVVAVRVVGDELARLLDPDGELRLDEIHEPPGVGSLFEEEIEPVGHGFDLHSLVMGLVLEHDLLEEEEGLFVLDLLSHLDDRVPGVVRVLRLAVGALLVVHDEGRYEGGLDVDVLDDLF